MARIEKTVFISYRRADVYNALAVYENLKNQGYDVFFDYTSIPSGDFEQIIISNIKARAHFLVILTPTALDRCSEPGDWLRREIEIAIDEKRNIIPLFFKGFRFGDPSLLEKLTGKLQNLSHYNGLNVHEDYFREAMQRLRKQFLNIPLNTVLHPVSSKVEEVVKKEQVAADKALKQKNEKKNQGPRFNWSLAGSLLGGLLIFSLLAWGISKLLGNLDVVPTRTNTVSPTKVITSQSVVTEMFLSTKANTVSPNKIVAPQPTTTRLPQPAKTSTASPTLRIGSTIVSEKDGMTLLYVPAGKFTMGSDDFRINEQPVHTVDLDAYWIDQTEVTNKMYALCVAAGSCKEPLYKKSQYMPNYYGNDAFDNHPVIWVDWNKAKTYCEWAGRRLPTEAEWEKAARGTDGRTYPWGEGSPIKNSSLLNYGHNSGDTEAVGGHPLGASPYRALDMAGNVWEWVNDWYAETYYSNSPTPNPLGPDSGQFRVMRGGSWKLGYPMNYHLVRSAYRNWANPSNSNYTIGFRCSRSP